MHLDATTRFDPQGVSGAARDPLSLDPVCNLDAGLLDGGPQFVAEAPGVKGALFHGERFFDQGRVEQARHLTGSRLQWNSDNLAKPLVLIRAQPGGPACDGIHLEKGSIDAVVEIRDEARIVEGRAQGRDQAAGIMIAVVYTRLIAERCPAQQAALLFEDEHTQVALAHREREATAEETSTDYNR